MLTIRLTGSAAAYELTVTAGESTISRTDALVGSRWTVKSFESDADPRTDSEAWRLDGEATGITRTLPSLDLRYGNAGPEGLGGTDHFGTIARTAIVFPAGSWRIVTLSDDGIRVWLGDELVIDDWTWHPAKRHVHEFSVSETTQLPIRVEHFELDGAATLGVEIEVGP